MAKKGPSLRLRVADKEVLQAMDISDIPEAKLPEPTRKLLESVLVQHSVYDLLVAYKDRSLEQGYAGLVERKTDIPPVSQMMSFVHDALEEVLMNLPTK